jgi:hypothetical protein
MHISCPLLLFLPYLNLKPMLIPLKGRAEDASPQLNKFLSFSSSLPFPFDFWDEWWEPLCWAPQSQASPSSLDSSNNITSFIYLCTYLQLTSQSCIYVSCIIWCFEISKYYRMAKSSYLTYLLPTYLSFFLWWEPWRATLLVTFHEYTILLLTTATVLYNSSLQCDIIIMLLCPNIIGCHFCDYIFQEPFFLEDWC